MHCSGCGKDIPFAGQVCPHCQRDKSGDQQQQALIAIGVVIGGVIGLAVNDMFGVFIGGVIGGIVGLVLAMSNAAKTKPPEVRIQESQISLPAAKKLSPEERLTELKTLREKGLLTEDEFSEKKKEILTDL